MYKIIEKDNIKNHKDIYDFTNLSMYHLGFINEIIDKNNTSLRDEQYYLISPLINSIKNCNSTYLQNVNKDYYINKKNKKHK